MPDDAHISRGFGGLTEWNEFVDRHLPKSNGSPRGKRSRQKIAKQYGFRLIRIGLNQFVDEEFEANRLRKIAQQSPGLLPRGPGRPRKTAKAAGEAA